MSTLSPTQEQTVTRAIEWALTERGVFGTSPSDSHSGASRAGMSSKGNQEGAPRSVSARARCLFCGAPGTRLCCDCDDLPALDYGQ